MSEPIMKFIRTAERMEEDDPPILYHDRVRTTGQTRQEMYGREEAGELRDKLSEILGNAEPAPVPGRITIPPIEKAHEGLWPVHFEHGGHFLNFSRPQLEAIVRQGLPMLSEAERREIAEDNARFVLDAEMGRWQNAIHGEVIRLTRCPPEIVDGKGSDGDELAFTLAEIGQAINWLIDEHEETAPSGRRPISRELAEGLWTMYQAALKNPLPGIATSREAFVEVLANGLRYSIGEKRREIVAQPQPSPDLKEALLVGLRTYATRYASIPVSSGSKLDAIFGEDHGEAMKELDRLTDHLAAAVAPAVPAGDGMTGGEREATAESLLRRVPVFHDRDVSEALGATDLGAREPEAPEMLAPVTLDRVGSLERSVWSCSHLASAAHERIDKLETIATPLKDARICRLEQHGDTHWRRIAGLESEVKTLRAELEGVGRRAAEAVEAVAARVAEIEGLDGRPSTV